MNIHSLKVHRVGLHIIIKFINNKMCIYFGHFISVSIFLLVTV